MTTTVTNDFSRTPEAADYAGAGINEVLISADSHVMEDPELWVKRLPTTFQDRAPRFPARTDFNSDIQGGWDPNARVGEMATDGVSAEVLYATLGLILYKLEDPALQEACFRVYNDWLAEYCSVAPDRLVGVPLIPAYDIDVAVRELERAHGRGLKGCMVWQAPPKGPEYSFRGRHYDPLWAAAQDLNMPVSLHIVTGFGFDIGQLKGLDRIHGAVNQKLMDAMDALFDLVYSGVMERFPRLKFVVVENEIGWAPFVVDQFDKYYRRWGAQLNVPISMPPSDYIKRQVFFTFFFDQVGGRQLAWWGEDNCMWSNDFPHPNSTWPNSRQVIARDLGHLAPASVTKLVRTNVARLYDITLPTT